MLKPVLLVFVLAWRWFVASVLGLRPFEVRVIRRVWHPVAPATVGRINVGSYTDEAFAVCPRPRVRHNQKEGLTISCITPKVGPFGSAPDRLSPKREQGVQVIVEVEGESGKHALGIHEADFTNPLSYSLVVRDAGPPR